MSLEFISNGIMLVMYAHKSDTEIIHPIQVDLDICSIDDFEIYVYDNKAELFWYSKCCIICVRLFDIGGGVGRVQAPPADYRVLEVRNFVRRG